MRVVPAHKLYTCEVEYESKLTMMKSYDFNSAIRRHHVSYPCDKNLSTASFL